MPRPAAPRNRRRHRKSAQLGILDNRGLCCERPGVSNDRDEIETSAPKPDFFKKFEARFIHDQAVERAKEVLRKGLELLSTSVDGNDGAIQTWCQQSLQAKLSAIGEAYDD